MPRTKRTAKKTAKKSTPERAVVIVDRGWIFAGDVTDKGSFIRIDRAVHVFRWDSIGFARMLEEWRSEQVDLRQMPAPVEVPKDAVIFRVPVADGWGIK